MPKPRSAAPGTFVRIPLPDGTFGYGRSLSAPYTAFYAHRTEKPSADLDEIEPAPILFIGCVTIRAASRWVRIGVRKLTGDVAKPVVRFWQDLVDPRNCVIYDSAGAERSATPEECVGLERASAWEEHHIEQRLTDWFMGRPNPAELHSRVRLLGLGD